MADGLCRLTPLPSQSGSWQIFMPEGDEMGEEEEVVDSQNQPQVRILILWLTG